MHKEAMFQSDYIREIATAYQRNMDGLGYLMEIVHRYHKNLTDISKEGNVTKSLEIPKFQDTTFFQFIEDCIEYFKNNDTIKPYTQAKYILEQITLDGRKAFQPAITALNTEINKWSSVGTGFVPNHLLLTNIRTWLMNHLSPQEQEAIAVKATVRRATINAAVIDVKDKPKRSLLSQKQSNSKPNDRDEMCSVCGTGGHTWKECRLKGKHLHIHEWIQRLKPETRKAIIEDFRKDRKTAYEKYKNSAEARRSTRKKIAALMDLCDEDETMDFHNEKMKIINRAYLHHDDLYYGSLDDELAEPQEPLLDPDTLSEFDSNTDNTE